MATCVLELCTAFCTSFVNTLAPTCADDIIRVVEGWFSGNDQPRGKNPELPTDKHLLNARRLQITHSENPDQWKWTSVEDETRFSEHEVAEMLSVDSLRIEAKLNFTDQPLKSKTKYDVYLIFKTKKKWRGLDIPLEAIVKKNWPQRIFVALVVGDTTSNDDSQHSVGEPVKRSDGWMELRLGMFLCDDKNKDQEVVVTLEQAEDKKSDIEKMKGLIIAGIELRSVEDSDHKTSDHKASVQKASNHKASVHMASMDS